MKPPYLVYLFDALEVALI